MQGCVQSGIRILRALPGQLLASFPRTGGVTERARRVDRNVQLRLAAAAGRALTGDSGGVTDSDTVPPRQPASEAQSVPRTFQTDRLRSSRGERGEGRVPAIPPTDAIISRPSALHNGTDDCEAAPRASPQSAAAETSTMERDERFRKRERLSGNPAFVRVQREGRSLKMMHFRVTCATNSGVLDATCTRVGIVTSKKSLRRAVDRVLMRRRFRDIFRKNKGAWPERVDIVIHVGGSALDAPYAELRQQMLQWAQVYVRAHQGVAYRGEPPVTLAVRAAHLTPQ